MPTTRERFLGCLLGGAAGDALGAPVEFLQGRERTRRFGPEGIQELAPEYGRLGAITDDTQMTLFTAEGLLRGYTAGSGSRLEGYAVTTGHAYARWLLTQGLSAPSGPIPAEDGWIFARKELHHRRAPGNTCLSALRSASTFGQPARNDSKGCGGVMRIAPAGLFAWHWRDDRGPAWAFALGTTIAGLTHGHPTGVLAAGVMTVLIVELASGGSLPDALATARRLLVERANHAETLRALDHAERAAAAAGERHAAIASLGGGWVAEEALAIAVYAALVASDLRDGVSLAVNHDGDSDSTGALAGSLLGTMHGADAIPSSWLEPLELRDAIVAVAMDLHECATWPLGDPAAMAPILKRYPPH
jgi:ADP-ribosylglycohydrolase